MSEQGHAFVTQLAKLLELVGVATIIGGIVLAAVIFIAHGMRTKTGNRRMNNCDPTWDAASFSGWSC